MHRRAAGIVGGIVASLGVVGCGSQGPALTSPAQLPGPASSSVATSSRPVATGTSHAAPRVSHVGSTVPVPGPGGASATVTLAGVLDPAVAAYPFQVPPAGSHLVGLRFVVADPGTVPLQENALSDISVTDANGAVRAPVIDEIAGCPSFTGGVIALAPAAAPLTGCVGFEMPDGVAVTAVHFALGGVAPTAATWAVP